MPILFRPHPTLGPSTPARDITYLLGQMKPDDKIVFTKAGLVGFLKTHGVEVETNLGELKGTVKYATFGSFEEVQQADAVNAPAAQAPVAVAAASPAPQQQPIRAQQQQQQYQQPQPQQLHNAQRVAESQSAAAYNAARGHIQHNPAVRDPSGDAFKPTRRVRELIGGGSAQISALFGGDDDDALAQVQAQAQSQRNVSPAASPVTLAPSASSNSYEDSRLSPNSSAATNGSFQPNKSVVDPEGHAFRPTRRVREAIGGGSEQIASLFGGGYEGEENQPPRRR